MKSVVKVLSSFWYSVLAWLIPMVVLMLLLLANPQGDVQRVRQSGSLGTYVLFATVILGVFHQLSNFLTNIPVIRRRSLLTILFLRMLVMTVLILIWEGFDIAGLFVANTQATRVTVKEILKSSSAYRNLLYILMVDTFFSWLYQLRTVVRHNRFHRLLIRS